MLLLYPRKTRDKLLESSDFRLSLELSIRGKLNPSPVWFAWGLSYFQHSASKEKLTEAREKFAEYIKVFSSYQYLTR